MSPFIKPILFTSLTLAVGIAFIHAGSSDEAERLATARNGVAVVELFTSEGCSSCPPADQALMDLVERTQRDGRKVFALSFHVDYWNRLGWKDRFSSGKWSDRQRVYSARTGDDVYTPQCLVNGTKSFVGSEVAELDEAVKTGLAASAAAAINAQVLGTANDLNIDYTVIGDVAGTELNIAVVESGLASDVRAGENSGRHLTHTQVVRSLHTIALGAAGQKGSAPIDMTEVSDASKAQVILFVQQKGQGAIIGAASVNTRVGG